MEITNFFLSVKNHRIKTISLCVCSHEHPIAIKSYESSIKFFITSKKFMAAEGE